MIQKVRSFGVSAVSESIVPKMFSEKAGESLKHYAVEGVEKAGVDGLCWALEAMAKRPDRTAVLKGLTAPVLIVHGAQDKIVPVSKARELADQCSQAVFVEVPGAGHATPLEAPDAVAAGLTRLLEVCHRREAEKQGTNAS